MAQSFFSNQTQLTVIILLVALFCEHLLPAEPMTTLTTLNPEDLTYTDIKQYNKTCYVQLCQAAVSGPKNKANLEVPKWLVKTVKILVQGHLALFSKYLCLCIALKMSMTAATKQQNTEMKAAKMLMLRFQNPKIGWTNSGYGQVLYMFH